MGLLEEYENVFNKYQAKYGDRIAVLMRKGDFYNLYGIDDGKDKMGNIDEICQVANLQRTRKNSKLLESGTRKNPYLAGFPHHQLERYVNTLSEKYGYYVVIIEQTTLPPGCKREVVDVVGPGTSKYTKAVSNYFFSLYIESEGSAKRKRDFNLVTMGISAIDILTGKTIIYESWNLPTDENRALDETYRMLRSFSPREILIASRGNAYSKEFLSKYLSLTKVNVRWIDVPPETYKPEYQNTFLKSFFKNSTMLSMVEYLSLDKMATSTISLMNLLEECKFRNESILKDLAIPDIWDATKHLILDNTCIDQLHITSKKNTRLSSIMNLVDYTSTPMGKRLLRTRMLLPLLDPKLIQKRYDYVDALLFTYEKYSDYLSKIKDLEKLHRRLIIGSLTPSELYQIYISYENLSHILSLLKEDDVLSALIPSSFEGEFNNLKNSFDMFSLEHLQNGILLPKNPPPLYEKRKVLMDQFDSLAQSLSEIIGKEKSVTHESNDEFGHYFLTTNPRYQKFQREFKIEGVMVISTKGNKTKFTSPQHIKYSTELDKLEKDYEEKIKNIYSFFLQTLANNFPKQLRHAERLAAVVDVYVSSAKSANLLKFNKPQLLLNKISREPLSNQEVEVPSYFEAYDLRHPLIENLGLEFEYIPQTIIMKDKSRGILLYGPNSAGKSSIMKAIGIAIILAQSGMYVPASKFIYNPYHTILTRIVSNDDLLRGLSLFAVEMGELRGILKRINKNSLVLGDEVCHGTETVSAVSLVASALKSLSSSGCTYFFATHLHELARLVKGLPDLSLYHLSVKAFDTGEIIYDRILTEGSGLSTYGIEIAKAMGLPEKFIEEALRIRKELVKTSLQKSRYNSKVFILRCEICGEPATDTHHIKYQSHADNEGYIGPIHKNSRSNLVGICKKCHDKIHSNQVVLEGYKLTTSGVKLTLEN